MWENGEFRIENEKLRILARRNSVVIERVEIP